MRPDPEPHDVRFLFHGKSPVVQANPNRAEAANSLEVQGGMPWVLQ
jgi:hypothetical protein